MLERSHPFESMAADLWTASSLSARQTLTNHNSADHHALRTAAVAAGAAVEHLLMACVASIDTALLADRSSHYSSVSLSRNNHTGQLDPRRLKTITWGNAAGILEVVDPGMSTLRDQLRRVMDCRNAAAHVAIAHAADVLDVAGCLAHIVEVLHRFLPDLPEHRYWGHHHYDLARTLRDARASAVERSYSTKVAVHAERFELMLPDVSPAERQAVYALMEARSPRRSGADQYADGTDRHPCPACFRSGYLHHRITLLDDQKEDGREYDEMGILIGASFSVSLEWGPLGFECPVCDLELTLEEVAFVPDIKPEAGQATHFVDAKDLI